MNDNGGYWSRRQLSRRAALRGALAAGGGLTALSLVGCGGDDDDDSGATGSPQTPSGPVDPKSGVQGGKLVFQAYADWGGIVLAKARNAGIHQAGSFTHSGLYQGANGRPGIDRSDLASELDLATAFPETPADKLTWIVKIQSGAKFHNGRVLTAEDVKYSYDRYAFAADSGYKADFTWLESVQAPDPTTIVFKTKFPFADVVGALQDRSYGHILAKEHEESPEAVNKLMGSGAFIFVDRQAPVINGRYRRNPEYYNKPYPYFDTVDVLGTSDTSKKIADFGSRQTHVMYWLDEERRDEVKKLRPDALLFINPFNGWAVTYKNDSAPFNDKRVRQAAALLLNRKQIIDGVYKGEGQDDQWFSWAVKTPVGNFRKPAELPGARLWKNDPQAAKQLLSAAGITQPIEMVNHHWDATVVGQGVVDLNTLISTQWRTAGFINSKDNTLTFPQYASTIAIGNFEGWHAGPSGAGLTDPAFGNAWRNAIWSPPEGIKGPSVNNAHTNDPKASELADKQMGQFVVAERRETYKQLEDIFSEEMYRLPLNQYTNNWFTDQNLQGHQIPLTNVNGSVHYVKYWWFKDGKAP